MSGKTREGVIMTTTTETKVYEFNLRNFQRALVRFLPNVQVVKAVKTIGGHRIYLSGSNIQHIRVPDEYSGLHNCINIYYGESSKSGFWWNHQINYQQLARELIQYHREEEYHGEIK